MRFTRSPFGNAVNLFFLLLLSLLMAIPMVYTVSSAFKPMDELFLFPPRLWVSNPTLANFWNLSGIMRDSWIPMSRYLMNSLLLTAIGVTGQVVFASMAAFVLSRETFHGKAFLNKVVMLSLMFSGSVTAVPNYFIMSRLGMINTHLSILLPAFCSSLGLFLKKQFMDQMIPYTVVEAARIDGANAWHQLWRIQLPNIWLVFSFVMFDCIRGTLQCFDIPFIMTNGGPGYASSTFTLYTIDTAFKYNSFGMAATMAVAIMAIVILVYVFQNVVLKKVFNQEEAA